MSFVSGFSSLYKTQLYQKQPFMKVTSEVYSFSRGASHRSVYQFRFFISLLLTELMSFCFGSTSRTFSPTLVWKIQRHRSSILNLTRVNHLIPRSLVEFGKVCKLKSYPLVIRKNSVYWTFKMIELMIFTFSQRKNPIFRSFFK